MITRIAPRAGIGNCAGVQACIFPVLIPALHSAYFQKGHVL